MARKNTKDGEQPKAPAKRSTKTSGVNKVNPKGENIIDMVNDELKPENILVLDITPDENESVDESNDTPTLYKPKDNAELVGFVNELLGEFFNGRPGNLGMIDLSDYQEERLSLEDVEELSVVDKEFYDGVEEWDVSNITSLECCFAGCLHINHDLSKWDVSNVTNFRSFLDGARDFCLPLKDWKIRRDANINDMFSDTGFREEVDYTEIINVPYKQLGRSTFSGTSIKIKRRRVAR